MDATSCPHARKSAVIAFATCPLKPMEPVCVAPTKLMRQ